MVNTVETCAGRVRRAKQRPARARRARAIPGPGADRAPQESAGPAKAAAGPAKIGGRIRRLRLLQQRTQQEIASACGFTKSLLSKIESDKVVPPVATLVKIAGALGTRISALLEDDGSGNAVREAAEQVVDRMVKTERGYWIYPFASHYQGKRMQPFLFVARKGEVKEHHLAHEGEEFIYVLEGEMVVQVGSSESRLRAGDSIYFDSTQEHQVIPVSPAATYLNVFV